MAFVDELMDLPNVAARDSFGRPVVYTAPGGERVELDAIYTQRHKRVSYRDGAPVTTIAPAIDVRHADIGGEPEAGGTVEVMGRIYRIVDLDEGNEPGVTVCILGRRS